MPVIDTNLITELKRMEDMVAKERYYLDQRMKIIEDKENRLRQNMLKDDNPMNLKMNLKSSLPSYLAPGNIGDINRVIWPFYFTTEKVIVGPESDVRSSFTVTQEASFVWMYYTKSVFILDTEDGSESYVDPNDFTQLSTGLSFIIRDTMSQREFFNRPINMDHVGNPRFPSTLPSPQLILPRGTYEVNFFNELTDVTYIPYITFFGYRLRLENANELLSTVYG